MGEFGSVWVNEWGIAVAGGGLCVCVNCFFFQFALGATADDASRAGKRTKQGKGDKGAQDGPRVSIRSRAKERAERREMKGDMVVDLKARSGSPSQVRQFIGGQEEEREGAQQQASRTCCLV